MNQGFDPFYENPDDPNFVPLPRIELPDEPLEWGDESEPPILPSDSLEGGLIDKQESKSPEQKSSEEKSSPLKKVVEKIKQEKDSGNTGERPANGQRNPISFSLQSKPSNLPRVSERSQSPPDLEEKRANSQRDVRSDSRHSSPRIHHQSPSRRENKRSPSPYSRKKSSPRRSPLDNRSSVKSHHRRSPPRRSRSPRDHYRSRSPRDHYRSRSPRDRYRSRNSRGNYRSRSPISYRRSSPDRGNKRPTSPRSNYHKSEPRNHQRTPSPKNRRVYVYESKEEMGRKRNGNRGWEPSNKRQGYQERIQSRRSKSPRFNSWNQSRGDMDGRKKSPANRLPDWPASDGRGKSPGTKQPNWEQNVRNEYAQVNQPMDPRRNSQQSVQSFHVQHHPIGASQGAVTRPNYLPHRIPSQSEMTYRPAPNYHQASTLNYHQASTPNYHQASTSNYQPAPVAAWGYEQRQVTSSDPRLGMQTNANLLPVNQGPPRIPPKYQQPPHRNASVGRPLLPTPAERPRLEVRPIVQSLAPSSEQHLSQPTRVTAAQRFAEKYNERLVNDQDKDPTAFDELKKKQEELRQKEMQKESMREQAIAKAEKKLEEEMNRKREARERCVPMQFSPDFGQNHMTTGSTSNKSVTVVTIDSPLDDSYERDRRSPSLEEITPLNQPKKSEEDVRFIAQMSGSKQLENPCKRCKAKEIYEPKKLANGKRWLYCYECHHIVLAEMRAKKSNVKPDLTPEEKAKIAKENSERAKLIAKDLKRADAIQSQFVFRTSTVRRRRTSGTRVVVGKPSRARSRSLSPESSGQVYRANDRFPDIKTIKFDAIQVSKCWNCEHPLNAPSDDIVLCKKCEKWNHNYHVDPVGYHSSEYRGNCIFCDQLKELKKNRKKKCKPIQSYPEVEVGDIEGEYTPSGEQNTWTFYWNYLKNGHNIKTGDVVYRKCDSDTHQEDECDLWWIQYIITDDKEKPWVNAVNLRLPQEIIRDKKQTFYAREVFPCTGGKDEKDETWFSLEDVVGRAVALPRKRYFTGRPRGFKEEDIYLIHKLWDSNVGSQGDTIDWTDEFKYFPLNEENCSWKEFKEPVKVFKRNLIIEDGSYQVYYPTVKGDRLT